MVTLRPSKWKRCLIIGCTILAGLFLGQVVAATVGYYRPTTMSWFSSRLIVDYLQSHPLRKLQIGAGRNDIPGWLNTDIEPGEGEAYLDASRRFPLPDRSFQYVFSEHVIEHLSYQDGLTMLKESCRILAPGGRMRIATPNLLKFVQLFQDRKTDEMRLYIQRKIAWHEMPQIPQPDCLIFNLELRSFGHQFVYDPSTLKDSLTRAGFQAIAEFKPSESEDDQLRGIAS